MSYTIKERLNSEEQTTGSSASAKKTYIIQGETSTAKIREAAYEHAPKTFAGLYRQSVELESTERPDFWYITVNYGKKPASDSRYALSNFRFDIARETRRIYWSKPY